MSNYEIRETLNPVFHEVEYMIVNTDTGKDASDSGMRYSNRAYAEEALAKSQSTSNQVAEEMQGAGVAALVASEEAWTNRFDEQEATTEEVQEVEKQAQDEEQFAEIVNREEFEQELAAAQTKKTYAPWERRDVQMVFQAHAQRRTGKYFSLYETFIQQSRGMYDAPQPCITIPTWFAAIVNAEFYECIIVEGQYEVGSIIDHDGKQWLVTSCQEGLVIPDDEDEKLDEHIGGWHSWLVKVLPGDQSLIVVSEQFKAGQADINGTESVKFPDEQYAFPLWQLAYSSELGLYQKSKFPEVK